MTDHIKTDSTVTITLDIEELLQRGRLLGYRETLYGDEEPEFASSLVESIVNAAATKVGMLGDAKAAIAEIEGMADRLRDAEERAADLRRRNRRQAIAGLVVLVAIVVMLLTGCSTSTPTAEPSPSPAPAPTAPVQPEPAKAEPTFWDNYAPAVKERITKEIEAGDCDAMQGEFDTAYNNRHRAKDKNTHLMEFLDKAMQDGGCYN